MNFSVKKRKIRKTRRDYEPKPVCNMSGKTLQESDIRRSRIQKELKELKCSENRNEYQSGNGSNYISDMKLARLCASAEKI